MIADRAAGSADPPRPGGDDPLRAVWTDPKGLVGFFTTVQNGPIVGRFLTTTIVYFFIAGVMALLMRTQLAVPENGFLAPWTYNQLFTMHGSTMMFLFAVPVMEAFANLLLPPMLGARELPFPRFTAFGYWTFLFGGLLFFASFVWGAVPDAGWFAYTPLSGKEYSPGLALDFWLLGLSVAEIAAIGAAAELTVAVLKGRGPGMALHRMPIFAWAVLAMALMIAFAFTPLIVGTMLLELDRKAGTRFFDVSGGGDPVLWQHLFWIFGHPDVYIQFIPATGMVSMIVATFARRPLVGYTPVVLAILATSFISFGLWVHHMFTVGLPVVGLSFFSAASFTIGIASGVQFFAWIATLWLGRPRLDTPLLWVIGFLVTFLLGGITGIMVASVPFDWQAHDTFFVVAHFHYVIIGGVVFPVVAAIYYWMPVMAGRLLSERLGVLSFWLTFVGFHVAFFPMHFAGLLGMPRRVYTYPPGVGLDELNLISTVGAYVLGLGFTLSAWNVVWSCLLKRGRAVDRDPWGAGTLDFAAGFTPPDEGYRFLPVVTSRYPCWQQPAMADATNADGLSVPGGEPRLERLSRSLATRPVGFRAGLMCSVLGGEPEAVIRMAGPSWWPLLLALAFLGEFVATLFDLWFLLAASVLAMIAFTVGWLWPSREERETALRPEPAEVEGVPVGSLNGRGFGYYAMWVVVLVMAVAVATMLFVYLDLGAHAEAWPPSGVARPGLGRPAAATALLVASALPVWWAERAIRRGRAGPMRVGLAVGWALGALFLGLQVVGYLAEGIDARHHAYGSAFLCTVGLHHLILVGALLMSAVVQLQGWLGYFSSRRNEAVQNTALLWHFTVASWLAVAAALYLVPYLT